MVYVLKNQKSKIRPKFLIAIYRPAIYKQICGLANWLADQCQQSAFYSISATASESSKFSRAKLNIPCEYSKVLGQHSEEYLASKKQWWAFKILLVSIDKLQRWTLLYDPVASWQKLW